VIFQGRWRGPHAATGDRSRSSGSTGQLTRIGWFMGRGGEHELRTYRPAKGDERETEDFRATTGPASKIELMEDVVVIAGPEADDLVGNAQEDAEVDEPRHPLREGVQSARALLLVM